MIALALVRQRGHYALLLFREDDDGFMLLLDGVAVAQIGVDYRLLLRLGGGGEIVIESTFDLTGPTGERTRIEPAIVTQQAAALPLLHQIFRGARIDRDATLRLTFYDGSEIEVPPSRTFENWQVTLSDGTLFGGLPGGEVAMFPAGT